MESKLIIHLKLPASFFSSLFALDIASFLDSPPWAFVVLGMLSRLFSRTRLQSATLLEVQFFR